MDNFVDPGLHRLQHWKSFVLGNYSVPDKARWLIIRHPSSTSFFLANYMLRQLEIQLFKTIAPLKEEEFLFKYVHFSSLQPRDGAVHRTFYSYQGHLSKNVLLVEFVFSILPYAFSIPPPFLTIPMCQMSPVCLSSLSSLFWEADFRYRILPVIKVHAKSSVK